MCAGRFVCGRATGILLIVLDMGVVQRGEKREEGEGVQKHPSAFSPILSPPVLSLPPPSLSLSFFVPLFREHPPSPQSPSRTQTGLSPIK